MTLIAGLAVCCIIFKLFGSLLMFVFSICLPLTSELFFLFLSLSLSLSILFNINLNFLVIFLHAALRLRNLKNKMANRIEIIGVTRTPMGCLLELLGATNEAAS
jgi:hypothetical protein